MIKKAGLTFSLKFLWLLIRYRLCLTITENVLTWDEAALTVSMIARYNINCTTIIWHELHDRAFGKTTTLLFPCLV